RTPRLGGKSGTPRRLRELAGEWSGSHAEIGSSSGGRAAIPPRSRWRRERRGPGGGARPPPPPPPRPRGRPRAPRPPPAAAAPPRGWRLITRGGCTRQWGSSIRERDHKRAAERLSRHGRQRRDLLPAAAGGGGPASPRNWAETAEAYSVSENQDAGHVAL